MRTFIVSEMTHEGRDKRLHSIPVPDVGEHGFYRHICVLSNFSHGRRKGASKRDRESYRDGCNWSPNRLYRIMPAWEFYAEANASAESLAGLLPGYVKFEEYAGGAGCEKAEDIPTIPHESIYSFLGTIHFDRKLRRYIDPVTNLPIVYSVIS